MATDKNSRKKTNRLKFPFSQILAILLIIFGASIIFYATFHQGYGWQVEKRIDSYSSLNQNLRQDSKPQEIYIPKLERRLQISDGFVENNRWTIASTGVSYLTTSGKLGEAGNVVLYGHNTQGVLGGLWRLQNDDVVEVTADSGKVYKYEIYERKEVKPNEVEILVQTDDSRLTIYTCSGFLDSARYVVVGELVS